MKTLVFAAVAGFAFALHAPASPACGYCVEDKIASVYDHAVMKKAQGSNHHVVFFHIDGTFVSDSATRRMVEASAGPVEGVDRGTVRVSLETASLSLAFDPHRTSLAAVQRTVDRRLASKKLSLFLLRVDQPAELKTAIR